MKYCAVNYILLKPAICTFIIDSGDWQYADKAGLNLYKNGVNLCVF